MDNLNPGAFSIHRNMYSSTELKTRRVEVKVSEIIQLLKTATFVIIVLLFSNDVFTYKIVAYARITYVNLLCILRTTLLLNNITYVEKVRKTKFHLIC